MNDEASNIQLTTWPWRPAAMFSYGYDSTHNINAFDDRQCQ